MKHLNVSCCKHALNDIEDISSFLDTLPLTPIAEQPWPEEYPYAPVCAFSMAFTAKSILLKYYVIEKEVTAIYRLDNEPVYKDSCVEFFIALPNEEGYYNLEFNCIGTCLAGFGPEKTNRKKISETILASILHQTAIEIEENGQFRWALSLEIPFSVFEFSKIQSLQNTSCKVNFYKCGDDLSDPHFLCWNGIEHPSPNFHLSAFFGEATFS